MLLKIAWRNVWRSKLRSAVVVLAIMSGVWALITLVSLSNGMIDSYIDNAISTELGHIQLHNPKFKDRKELTNSIQSPDSVVRFAEKLPNVTGVSYRTVVEGMVSTGHGVRGVQVQAIDPAREKKVIDFKQMVKSGAYLDTNMRHAILIGKKLAEKLQTRIGHKVVITFQDADGNLSSAAFRICGMYESQNSNFDETHVFVRFSDFKPLIGDDHSVQEIALKCQSDKDVPVVQKKLEKEFPALDVENYAQLAPEIDLFKSQIKSTSRIFIVICMLALVFGIINTMLMAVLERVRELGMLMAIGMNRQRVFWMIVIETIMLALLGGPLGMFIGWLTVQHLGVTGVDLSQWASGLSEFGLSSKLYPDLQASLLWEVPVAVVITAVIGAIYPAIKAIRLRPVEALQKL